MDKKTVKIAPSILSADFGKLGDEIRDVERGGCDLIHVDVMDGVFVPNITIGPCVVRSLRKLTKLTLDVHLMIDNPIRYIEDFRKAGSDWITIHAEAEKDIELALKKISGLGAKPGISIKPATPLGAISRYLDSVQLVLIMTVEPGFGGQNFMPEAAAKIKELRKTYKGLISVDGGITPETARVCVEGGVDILVAGTSVFGTKDRKLAIEALRG
ncbi:MAG: ribulose-phosphate 3-epimerase [Candidatus Omnitrophica bacterium]|nr:ribulose-phosphate 3-epimerase [Candidatus Omnitrophota bacterium]